MFSITDGNISAQFMDPATCRPDAMILDPAGSAPDTQNPPDIRPDPDLDPVHPLGPGLDVGLLMVTVSLELCSHYSSGCHHHHLHMVSSNKSP